MKTKQLNKVRAMEGVRPGRGSAGRANSNAPARLQADASGRFTGFGDVGRACELWLLRNDPDYRKQREWAMRADAGRMERRVMAEGGVG